MNLLWLSLLLWSSLSTIYAQCEEDQDQNVYSFGYGFQAVPYEYLNKDGELVGIGYDIVRAVCKVMNRKCVHHVYYDYGMAWDGHSGVAMGLNNRWYSAQASWLQTPQRMSAYSFFGEYAREHPSYIYVKRGSGLDTLDDVKRNANNIGFRTGFYTDDQCLQKYLDQPLANKARFYGSQEPLEAALASGEVDAIFVGEHKIIEANAVSRVGSEKMQCAVGGVSMMTRKDTLHQFSWFDEGLAQIRENGDYDWLCNIYEASGPSPRCL